MPNPTEIEIREYNTVMSDGSITTVCIAEHEGQKIAASYAVSALEALLSIDEIDAIIAPRRAAAHDAIHGCVAVRAPRPTLAAIADVVARGWGTAPTEVDIAQMHAAAAHLDAGPADVPPADKLPE